MNTRLPWVGIALGLLGLLVAIMTQWSGGEDERINGLVSGSLAAALFLPACVWRLLRLARAAKVRIYVFAEGMLRLDGNGPLICRWDEIDTVRGILKRSQVSPRSIAAL